MTLEELKKELDAGESKPASDELARIVLNSDISKIKYFSVSWKPLAGNKGRLYTTVIYDDYSYICSSSALDKSICIDIIDRVEGLNLENPLFAYSDILSVDVVNLEKCTLDTDNVRVDGRFGLLISMYYNVHDNDYREDMLLYLKPKNVLKFKKDLEIAGRYDILMILECGL